jgi:hypothetical protein
LGFVTSTQPTFINVTDPQSSIISAFILRSGRLKDYLNNNTVFYSLIISVILIIIVSSKFLYYTDTKFDKEHKKDEMAAFEPWEEHLKKVLSFPFEAVVVDEFQERSPLRAGEQVTVQSLADVVGLYGVFVKVKQKHRQ